MQAGGGFRSVVTGSSERHAGDTKVSLSVGECLANINSLIELDGQCSPGANIDLDDAFVFVYEAEALQVFYIGGQSAFAERTLLGAMPSGAANERKAFVIDKKYYAQLEAGIRPLLLSKTSTSSKGDERQVRPPKWDENKEANKTAANIWNLWNMGWRPGNVNVRRDGRTVDATNDKEGYEALLKNTSECVDYLEEYSSMFTRPGAPDRHRRTGSH